MFFDTHITSVLKRAFDLHRNGRGITLSRQKPTGNDHNPLGKGGVPNGTKPHNLIKRSFLIFLVTVEKCNVSKSVTDTKYVLPMGNPLFSVGQEGVKC